MALAPLLYNITFDSQTRILYFWDKAGHEIYHCEVPSYAPALPTVSEHDDFSVNNWLYAQGGGVVRSISAGESIDLYRATSSGYVKVLFDTSKKYAVLTWYFGTGSGDKGVNGSLSIFNTGYVAAKNETNSTLSLYALRCAVCSSSDATVITVYDSSNNPYNAFQYTSDGTDYYYVLDGTQTDWTDDLSAIGYHVLYTAWFNADHTIKSSISEMKWYDLYDDNGQYITSGFPDPFTSHSFTLVNAYRGDSIVPCSFYQFSIISGHLIVNMDVSGQSLVYITYMETPTE